MVNTVHYLMLHMKIYISYDFISLGKNAKINTVKKNENDNNMIDKNLDNPSNFFHTTVWKLGMNIIISCKNPSPQCCGILKEHSLDKHVLESQQMFILE